MSRLSFLAGLIGSGIGASRTPPMHEREGDEQGLRYTYQNIDLDRLGLGADALPDLLLAAERMGFSGLNITHPCKQAVVPLLDELSSDAQALGAGGRTRTGGASLKRSAAIWRMPRVIRSCSLARVEPGPRWPMRC